MSLRAALLILAIVPGVALAALWAVTSGQTFLDYQSQAAQNDLAQSAGPPSNVVFYNLQEERRLSAAVLASPSSDAVADLRRQRVRTDGAVGTFKAGTAGDTDGASVEVRSALSLTRKALDELPEERSVVDHGNAIEQNPVYRYYTNTISLDIQLFTVLGHADDADVASVSQPLVDMLWGKEMISRTDALLARAWPAGKLNTDNLKQVRLSIAQESFQYDTKVQPFLTDAEQTSWQAINGSPAWTDKAQVETSLQRAAAPDDSGLVSIGASEGTWRGAVSELSPQLEHLIADRTDAMLSTGKDGVRSLLLRTVLTALVGLAALVAVVFTTWRLTLMLRRRIGALQERAEELERALPDVVERLGLGERIDVDAEVGSIEHDDGTDELAQLGRALNLARASALQAAVNQAEQHRGFERLLQRIARRTQRLIGQQLKKLDELERRHDDPQVLDGLFDLDHLTARLRRYEENLVILSGGSPHRRWRRPVPLLDVMRSAQGEVQDYRRVVLDLESSVWLSERAVGPVSHVLAELIENALAFSRPPSPVEVRAAKVSRGLAIEVEDRGLGMDADQIAEANELMNRPPRMDVLARSEDVRLGLQVVARLADQHGLRVEFRPSAFGGTRVVLLVPDSLTVPEQARPRPVGIPPAGPGTMEALPPEPDELPQRVQGRALATATAQPYVPAPYPVPDHGYPAPEQPFAGQAPYQGPSDPPPYPPQQPQVAVRTTPFPPEAPLPYGLAGPAPVHQAPPPAAAPAAPRAEAPTGGTTPDGVPLPRRVRQASLVDELRVNPQQGAAAPRPPSWDENPLLRPVPRRAGAAIGAFQRQSRAARGNQQPPAAPEPQPFQAPQPPPFPPREDMREERP